MAEIKLLNERKAVGFPEGQLLEEGATEEQAAQISEAFHRGQPIPTTGNEALDRIAQRLTQVSGKGAWRDES
jgi:hypothetical protein